MKEVKVGTIPIEKSQTVHPDERNFSFRNAIVGKPSDKKMTYVTIENQQQYAEKSVQLQSSSWKMNSKSASLTA